MLSTLRHKGVSRKILWGVAIIVILSFGVFGTAYRLDNTVNSAGKIFGRSVGLRDFETAYLDSRDQAIFTYGDRFFKMGQNIDMEREAWTRLILLHEAAKRHIKAADQEVVEFIASVPFFQHQGKFDQSTYESLLRDPRVFDRNPKDFEEGVRGGIIIRKLLEAAAGNIVISDNELKQEYIKRLEKIKLSYALLDPADFSKGQNASDEEARKFYEARKEDFRQPPMINVQYVHLVYPDKADEAQKAAVKKDAQAIAKELKDNADLAAVAKKYHQAAKDSGYFTHEQPLLTFAWSPDFVDTLFAMKEGASSGAVETPDGWEVVRIKQKQGSSVPEYAAIADKVKQAVVNQKAADAAAAKAEADLKTIREGLKDKDFNTLAQKLGLKTQETASFSRGEYINAPGLVAEFQEASLKLNADNKLGLVSTSQGPAILYLSSVEPIDEKKFTQDKEDFRQMMTAQKRNEAIAVFVTGLKFEAALKTDLKGKVRYR